MGSELRLAFEVAYKKRFGRNLSEDFAPEVVGLRVTAKGPAAFKALALSPTSDKTERVTPIAHRQLHLMKEGWVEAPVWRRELLGQGAVITGPAIIEEFGSTTLLGFGDTATVGSLGEIAINLGKEES